MIPHYGDKSWEHPVEGTVYVTAADGEHSYAALRHLQNKLKFRSDKHKNDVQREMYKDYVRTLVKSNGILLDGYPENITKPLVERIATRHGLSDDDMLIIEAPGDFHTNEISVGNFLKQKHIIEALKK